MSKPPQKGKLPRNADQNNFPAIASSLLDTIGKELANKPVNYEKILQGCAGFPLSILNEVFSALARAQPSAALNLFCSVSLLDSSTPIKRSAIQALGFIHLAESIQALIELEYALDSSPLSSKEKKELNKEISRSLHRLKSAGVQPKDFESTPLQTELNPNKTSLSSQRQFVEALVSNLDGVGNILGVLILRSPGGKFETAMLQLNDNFGLRECRIYSFNQRQLDAFKQEWNLPSAGINLIPAPQEYLNWLVSKHLNLNRLNNQPLPADFRLWQRYFPANQDQAELNEHPVYEKIPLSSIQETRLLLTPQTGYLNATLEMRNWLLEPEIVLKHAKKLLELRQSRIIVTETFIQGYKDKILHEIAETLFTPEFIQKYRQRLEHMAMYFFLDSQNENARLSLTAALNSRSDTQPMQNPVLRNLLLTSLDSMVKLLEAGPNAETHLTGEPAAMENAAVENTAAMQISAEQKPSLFGSDPDPAKTKIILK